MGLTKISLEQHFICIDRCSHPFSWEIQNTKILNRNMMDGYWVNGNALLFGHVNK